MKAPSRDENTDSPPRFCELEANTAERREESVIPTYATIETAVFYARWKLDLLNPVQ